MRSGHLRRRGPAGLACAAVLSTLSVGLLSGVGVPLPAASAVGPSCETTPDSPVGSDSDLSLPLLEMQVPQAQAYLERQDRESGQGVTVAVIDSGVAPEAIFNRAANPDQTDGVRSAGTYVVEDVRGGAPMSYHGTAVAGLIAGQPRSMGQQVGVAPGASILDVKVYDDEADTLSADGTTTIPGGPTPVNVLRGLQYVEDHSDEIDIVNLSLIVQDYAPIRRSIDHLWRLGVIVVSGSGNRPGVDDPGDPLAAYAGRSPLDPASGYDEDAAQDVFPAAYPHVVVVGATADVPAPTTAAPGVSSGDQPEAMTDPSAPASPLPDASQYVVLNSRTDVATPTLGAVSYDIHGGTCEIPGVPATSWSTAYVSGVLAMLKSAFPKDTPAQLVARMEQTADGRADGRNKLTGAGVVQPLAALTRRLQMDRQGVPVRADARPARTAIAAPVALPDVLGSTRHQAVWWGLFGGGALLLAAVLRPLLTRRRR